MNRRWFGPFRQRARRGFTLIELLIGIVIIGLLLSIAIPMMQAAQMRARYTRAGANCRVIVAQAVAYAITNGNYPHGVAELRNMGFVSVPDRDPWNTDYQMSAALENAAPADSHGDIWVCSMGPIRIGTCPDPAGGAGDMPGFPHTGLNGSVGFSSVYGPWAGF